jgi:hypothetical protein
VAEMMQKTRTEKKGERPAEKEMKKKKKKVESGRKRKRMK